MSSSIPPSAYVEHFDPELAHHRAWLLAVLERLVSHDPQALGEGGTLRRLWTEHQQSAISTSQSQRARTPQPLPEGYSAFPRSAEAPRGNPLSVPWFSQLDSSTDQARRMCFWSSCAMLLAFLRFGVLSGANGDDQYLQRVRRYGDTADPAAQLQALASYGIKAEFSKQAGFRTIETQIAAGIPVPCGYLHRGPLEKPAGAGHCPLLPLHPPQLPLRGPAATGAPGWWRERAVAGRCWLRGNWLAGISATRLGQAGEAADRWIMESAQVLSSLGGRIAEM